MKHLYKPMQRIYKVVCPECGVEIISDDFLVICPHCGELIQIDEQERKGGI